MLKKLQPRLYSISSSPKAHAGEVHLCVGVVRYDSLGRPRKGVCSTYLAERVPAGGAVPVFMHHNKNFRPPANPDAPMIMVGPGTGIAPFRAFLEERRASGAKGKNWLFFGDQRASTDYLFRDELDAMQAEADDILRTTLTGYEAGAIDGAALTAFSVALEQFHNAVADRKALLAEGQVLPQPRPVRPQAV